MTKPSESHRWADLYNQVPLCEVPRHYAAMNASPFLLDYLTEVLRVCPRGGRTLETGIGSGYGAIWLSERGIRAEGIDYSQTIVERGKQINNLLHGTAQFRFGDIFDFYLSDTSRYDVIHHQGVLEHFTVPQIRAALSQQVARANYVVFSVPSVNYPFDPEFGDERLMTVEDWRYILSPFDIADLRYYGDPRLGGQEQILCVLRGQRVTSELESLMRLQDEPFPSGISAIVHARNESKNIAECLRTLQGWTDEIIVCDMESDDDTVEIARQFTDKIIRHPRIQNFDRARNVSAMHAKYRWVFYLDADERVPAGLGGSLKALTSEPRPAFDALLIPFRHHFAGHWMQCLYPGYTAPRLLKNGKFIFNARLHSGAEVNGNVLLFPADNPGLALDHYSFDNLAHYLDKLNRYTDGEASNMHRDGAVYHWTNAIRHFVGDFQSYYEQGGATRDGVHGFLYSFLSAFYRFEQHAKLYEKRFQNGQLQPFEHEIPGSLVEMLEYALAVAKAKPAEPRPQLRIADDGASIAWCGPVLDRSGYGEESRHLLFALDAAINGSSLDGSTNQVAALDIPWGDQKANISDQQAEHIQKLLSTPVKPGFFQIVHNLGGLIERHPQAGIAVARTMFETDRLPQDWVKACRAFDVIWVPSEFNRNSFAQSGVPKDKIFVVPECIDPEPYSRAKQLAEELKSTLPLSVSEVVEEPTYSFLSVFDWTRHKGWDILLKAFLQEFDCVSDVRLYLKVWSTMGYDHATIVQQAREFIQSELGLDISADTRIRFINEYLDARSMIALYGSVQCYVMPSRGEGWGRPYMEAMACGLPVIGTNWSGNTAFMDEQNSYLIDCSVVPIPEFAWREVQTYKGHQWAEPSVDHLKLQMRRVYGNREEAERIGQAGKCWVSEHFSETAVGPQIVSAINSGRDMVSDRKIADEQQSKNADAIRVRWEGPIWQWHSLAHVNRELCLGLTADPTTALSLVPNEPPQFSPNDAPQFEPLAALNFASWDLPADVHVRHFFPPRFDTPSEGHLVLMQPWEYGYLPKDWIAPIAENVSEVWCNSEYVREVYANSGVPKEILHLLPLGVDTEVFNPSAPPYIYTTEPGTPVNDNGERPFVFLYVGGTVHRKGGDILIDAYTRAFTSLDNVLLVVKDTGTKTVYRDHNEGDRIRELIQMPNAPGIVYIDDDLSAHQLAGIYTSADCMVQPYRGEGFCLPVLEAMACGIPAVVPAGGATDDFVDDTVGYRIPALRKLVDNNRIGPWECAGPAWMFEVDPVQLGLLMRSIAKDPEAVKQKGDLSAGRVAEQWTWSQSSRALKDRLAALKELPLKNGNKKGDAHDATSAIAPESAAPDLRASKAGKTVATRRPLISLCMIVKNEERVLGACLKSISPWVDEVIVVDTGSTDRTVEIAKDLGARVEYFPWTNSFSEARNVSLSYATGDWILWMDADDTIPEECARQLKDMVLRASAKTTGIIMQVHIPPGPGENGFTVVDHVKLFRNLPGLQFEGRIHEQILEPIYRIGGTIERSSLHVVHSGYDYSPEGQKLKRERDLKLLALDLEERPDHPFVLFNIGMTAYHMKEFDKAKEALEKCLSVSKPQESTVRKVYAMLAGCALGQNNVDQAVLRVKQGLSLYPNDPELLFRGGISFHEAKDYIAAERCYLSLLNTRESGHIDSLDVSMTGFKAHHNLAIVYQDMGKLNESESQWKLAVDKEPGFVPSWIGLSELYLRTGRVQEAQSIVNKLEQLDTGQAATLRQRLEHLLSV